MEGGRGKERVRQGERGSGGRVGGPMRLNQIARVVVHVNSFKPPPTVSGLNGVLQKGHAESERVAAAYAKEMRGCLSAMEFARRCVERRAAASNPKCKVEVKHRADDFRPTVFVQYGTYSACKGEGFLRVPDSFLTLVTRTRVLRVIPRRAQRTARSSSSIRKQ